MNLSDAEAAWLAAAVDGEGSITVGRRSGTVDAYIPLVMVYNSDLRFLGRASEYMKRCGGVANIQSMGATTGSLVPMYRVKVASVAAVDSILSEIGPWLLIKADRAEAIRDWIAARRGAGYRKVSGTPETAELERRLKVRARKPRYSGVAVDSAGQTLEVGDVVRSIGWTGGGFPLVCTVGDLTVVRVNRTRVVVTGAFGGEIAVIAAKVVRSAVATSATLEP